MKDQVISFETAQSAKEKGFNIPTLFYFSGATLINPWDSIMVKAYYILDHNRNSNNPYSEHKFYSAPTQVLLQKWLRDTHKIHIEVLINRLLFTSYRSETFIEGGEIIEQDVYCTTYEEALEAALIKGLNLIKV